ncbi:MAG TPA: hypothetical protein VGC06_13565 [Actinomycetes bacterium]
MLRRAWPGELRRMARAFGAERPYRPGVASGFIAIMVELAKEREMRRNRTWSWLVAGVLGVVDLLVGLNTGAQGREGASDKAQTADVTLKELTISPSTIRLEAARPAVNRPGFSGG